MKKYLMIMITMGIFFILCFFSPLDATPQSSGYSSSSDVQTTTVGNVNFEMVYVEGGTFAMGCDSEKSDCNGDESTTHSVTLSSFYIGKYEVTQAQWKTLMDCNSSYFKGDTLPVDQVSWTDVQDFISKLNAQTGKHYRLPTEAEWEFAARGGNQSNGTMYSGADSIDIVGWYSDNSDNKTHPVGQKSPNELGIYDMTGNVLEWCSDWYDDYSNNSQTNPMGPTTGSQRVLRGGCWIFGENSCRIYERTSDVPIFRSGLKSDIGFRLALDK